MDDSSSVWVANVIIFNGLAAIWHFWINYSSSFECHLSYFGVIEDLHRIRHWGTKINNLIPVLEKFPSSYLLAKSHVFELRCCFHGHPGANESSWNKDFKCGQSTGLRTEFPWAVILRAWYIFKSLHAVYKECFV